MLEAVEKWWWSGGTEETAAAKAPRAQPPDGSGRPRLAFEARPMWHLARWTWYDATDQPNPSRADAMGYGWG